MSEAHPVGTPEERHRAWVEGLPEEQARRHYPPWGDVADVSRHTCVGRYVLMRQTTGAVAVIDPWRPWNDAIVEVFADDALLVRKIERLALLHPGSFEP